MERAPAGFVCPTVLQELLLAHRLRVHHFVDLLAGVRRGGDRRGGGGGEDGGDEKRKTKGRLLKKQRGTEEI